MSECTELKRLDRIEELLTKLTDLLVNNATCDVRIDHVETETRDHESRLRRLESISGCRTTNNKWLERLLWLLLTTVVGVVASGVHL